MKNFLYPNLLKSLEKLLSLSYNNNAIISQFNTYYLCKQSFVFVKNVLCVVLFRCADNDVRCEMIAKSQDNGTFLYAVSVWGLRIFYDKTKGSNCNGRTGNSNRGTLQNIILLSYGKAVKRAPTRYGSGNQ